MPTKGQFTAAVAVLCDAAPAADAVAAAVARFRPFARADALDHWALGGPSVVLPFRREVNGAVVVDVVPHPWPEAFPDGLLAAAWAAGNFGPAAHPGGLARAALQCWGWDDAEPAARRHRAFVRLRTSYVLGAADGAPLLPPGYDPLAELRFLTDAATEVLSLPGALCYFNPNGEALRPASVITDALRYADGEGLPPLDLWANVRLFEMDDGWGLMDTVGHAQFEKPGLTGPFPDLEALLPPDADLDPQEVDGFLRNVTLALLERGPAVTDGEVVDGPGDRKWTARVRRRGLVMPPRPTVRFAPDGTDPPAAALADPETPAG